MPAKKKGGAKGEERRIYHNEKQEDRSDDLFNRIKEGGRAVREALGRDALVMRYWYECTGFHFFGARQVHAFDEKQHNPECPRCHNWMTEAEVSLAGIRCPHCDQVHQTVLPLPFPRNLAVPCPYCLQYIDHVGEVALPIYGKGDFR